MTQIKEEGREGGTCGEERGEGKEKHAQASSTGNVRGAHLLDQCQVQEHYNTFPPNVYANSTKYNNNTPSL
jgi:hypothetical protein